MGYYGGSDGSANYVFDPQRTFPAPPNSEFGWPIMSSENGDFLPPGYPQTKEGELAYCEQARRVTNSPFRARIEAQMEAERNGDATYGRIYGLDGIRPVDYRSDTTGYGTSRGGSTRGSESSAAGNSAPAPFQLLPAD